MSKTEQVARRIDEIITELSELKDNVVALAPKRNGRKKEGLKHFLSLSKQVTRKWKGPSAVEEIRSQREKGW